MDKDKKNFKKKTWIKIIVRKMLAGVMCRYESLFRNFGWIYRFIYVIVKQLRSYQLYLFCTRLTQWFIFQQFDWWRSWRKSTRIYVSTTVWIPFYLNTTISINWSCIYYIDIFFQIFDWKQAFWRSWVWCFSQKQRSYVRSLSYITEICFSQ